MLPLLLAITPPCPPNADASVSVLVEPGPVHLESAVREAPSKIGEVFVTIRADGTVDSAAIYCSTGDMELDQALLRAAATSQYSPAIVDCKPVVSKYDYRMKFGPYGGDDAKDDARFKKFINVLLATGRPPVDSGIHLDSTISSDRLLHDIATELSPLGLLRGLHLFDDDVIGGMHRFYFAAQFEKGKADVVFWVDEDGAIAGFTYEKQ